MHQTCASDSLNLPGPQHINKVCLEWHLTEGEVAGVGEPPAVNDRLQKQVQNDSISSVVVTDCWQLAHSRNLSLSQMPFQTNFLYMIGSGKVQAVRCASLVHSAAVGCLQI